MMIEFKKVGKILKGDDVGQFIRVEHDPDDTGGFYIYQSTIIDFSSSDTFDSWVETRDDLDSFFKESKWVIDWNVG